MALDKIEHEIYEKARKRVKQKKRLYYHFIIFLVGGFLDCAQHVI